MDEFFIGKNEEKNQVPEDILKIERYMEKKPPNKLSDIRNALSSKINTNSHKSRQMTPMKSSKTV